MLFLKNVCLSWVNQNIFTNFNLSLSFNEKVGIVGRNGAGKSTLLKMIAGFVKPDEGIINHDKTKKIAYMPQEVVLQSKKTVFDEAFTVFAHYTVLADEQKQIENRLQQKSSIDTEKMLARYADLHDMISQFDVTAAMYETKQLLSDLGFQDITQPVDVLSVGWKMRLVLAKLLLEKADFYLFDEPTNHLDISTKAWFFDFLKKSNAGFLLVSHDRYYLEHACTKILHLESGQAKLYNGNFTQYLVQKEHDIAAQKTAYERQQREIAQKTETINRFRASANKAKMAQSMVKQLEKIELLSPPNIMPTVSFRFAPLIRSGEIVLKLQNLGFAFGEKHLFANVSAEIKRGKKIALIAPNGSGKTTLFNLITGIYELQKGSINLGHNVTVAYFQQDQTRILDPEKTILQEIVTSSPLVQENTIRTMLGSFLFSGDDVDKKIKVLSGGEKNRVAMVKLLLKKANFLVLDEPTNHIDLYAQEVLLQALQQYEGTMLIVSHDQSFIQRLATDILELNPNGLHLYHGDYESYCYQKKMLTQAIADQEQKIPKKENNSVVDKIKDDNKELFALRKKSNSLEQKIAKLEQEQTKLIKEFEKISYGTSEYASKEKELKNLQALLQQVMLEWESLQAKI